MGCEGVDGEENHRGSWARTADICGFIIDGSIWIGMTAEREEGGTGQCEIMGCGTAWKTESNVFFFAFRGNKQVDGYWVKAVHVSDREREMCW